jgi:ATP-binding cassette subfamily B protein
MSQRITRRTTTENKETKPTLRERLAALRYIPPLLKLVWRTHRGLTLAMIALRMVRAVTPVLTLWVGKLIIDEIVIAQRTSAAGISFDSIELNRLWQLVAMEIVIVVDRRCRRACICARRKFARRFVLELHERALDGTRRDP